MWRDREKKNISMIQDPLRGKGILFRFLAPKEATRHDGQNTASINTRFANILNLNELALIHNKLNMKIVVSLSLLAMVAAANAFVVFDDFSTSQSAVILNGLGSGSNSLLVGAYNRQQLLTVLGYNDPDQFERAYTRVSGGSWIGSSDVDVNGIWSMIYSAPSSALANLNTFELDFTSIDQNSFVTVMWQSGSAAAIGQANVNASNSLQQIVVGATNVDAGFDWNNVTSVMFTINGPAGLDFKIDQLKSEAVPEPASIIALGLGGLALIRRRRQA